MRKSQPNFRHWIQRAMFSVAGVLTLFLLQGQAVAQDPEQSAHEFAREVKDELVTVIRNKQELEQQGGQEKYVGAIKDVLVPVVDFDYIARGVMGQYASEATPEQREQFAEKFQQSLVNTYAKGLAGYGDYEITVVPPEEDVSGQRTVGVWLNVSNGDVTHRLAFTTKLNREGEWKVTNMILNGINLGKAFRGQFENAVRQHGSIEAAIENWAV
jgi:phospholipid transport system substrate-binding protein